MVLAYMYESVCKPGHQDMYYGKHNDGNIWLVYCSMSEGDRYSSVFDMAVVIADTDRVE
jgi:hypothetical protein